MIVNVEKGRVMNQTIQANFKRDSAAFTVVEHLFLRKTLTITCGTSGWNSVAKKLCRILAVRGDIPCT